MTVKEFDIQVALGSLNWRLHYEPHPNRHEEGKFIMTILTVGEESYTEDQYPWLSLWDNQYMKGPHCSTKTRRMVVIDWNISDDPRIVNIGWVRAKFIEEGILTE